MEGPAQKPNPVTDDEEARLWGLLESAHDATARERIITHYLPFAKATAARLYRNRPSSELEFGDYLQLATVGLIEAVDRYEAGHSASFKTFATYRIQGAVLSGIEKLSERMEQGAFRRRVREERAAMAKAGLGGGDLFQEMVDAAIGLALGYMLGDSGMYHGGDEASKGDEPYNRIELKRLQERVNAIVDALPHYEKQIIQYHYYHWLSFTEIAEILQLSKGRISQLHARALALIREAYENWHKLDVRY